MSKTSLFLITLLLGTMSITTACGRPASGTSASMSFGAFTAQNNQENRHELPDLIGMPKLQLFTLVLPLIEKPAHASTSGISLCIRRVRFKAAGEMDSAIKAEDPDNDDLSHDNRVGTQGLIGVNSGGTIGTVIVPNPKVAARVRIDVDNHCSNGLSTKFTTANGTFQSTSGFTMEFDSTAGVDLTTNNVVVINWQAVNSALNALFAGATDAQVVSALSTIGSM